MSIQDGTIGNRKNGQAHIRLDIPDEKTLEQLTSMYNASKSDILRWGLNKIAYAAGIGIGGIDYAKAEINNAVAKVKNGYQRTTQRVKDYFAEPEDAYLPAYAPVGYGLMPAYR